MTHACDSTTRRSGSRSGVVVGTVAILCIASLGKSQPTTQNEIKRKLIIAEELSLELPGAKLAAHLSKAASGMASLSFFDSKNHRSVGVTVQSDGRPTVFLTTPSPRTLTSLGLSPSGSARLQLGEESELEGPSLPPCVLLSDSAAVMFVGADGETRVSIDAGQAKQVRSGILLRDRQGKFLISLLNSDSQLSQISLNDRNKVVKSTVVIESPGGPSIFFGDSQQRPRLVLDLDAQGTPKIMLQDPVNRRSQLVK
jgi:hypothetical protein